MNREEALTSLANPAFADFLHTVEVGNWETNYTSTGALTIQQSARNQLRREGLAALKADLTALYHDVAGFDVVETKEGIVIVAENDEFTFSWEIKSTIKSLDYEPFEEANAYDDEVAAKAAKKAAKAEAAAAKAAETARRRAAKVAEAEARGERRNSDGNE